MNPWGIETFENEIACDWLEDLQDSEPVAFVKESLHLHIHQRIPYVACIGVVCAAELVHCSNSKRSRPVPLKLYQWIEKHPRMDFNGFIIPAIVSMRRVLHPQSELRIRWEDNETLGPTWLRNQNRLIGLLESDFVDSRLPIAG
ncbi:MAG: DUF4259 domain-containing protein [Rubripirellula sp.]